MQSNPISCTHACAHVRASPHPASRQRKGYCGAQSISHEYWCPDCVSISRKSAPRGWAPRPAVPARSSRRRIPSCLICWNTSIPKSTAPMCTPSVPVSIACSTSSPRMPRSEPNQGTTLSTSRPPAEPVCALSLPAPRLQLDNGGRRNSSVAAAFEGRL